ncbi:imelysin family protein [Sediminicola luteus]|uniref:Imelysin n=1 Tax=Sediminicola luteus TaxID=319238 RepID=A0A2A4G8Q5_9FLAO|nr:imelysin family protein [Sediminicola luteus]PCE65007.1 imelysin [Sediminicola luteus]
MKTYFNPRTLLTLLAASIIIACSSDDNGGETPQPKSDYKGELTNTANNVITETYKTLNDRALALQAAVNDFTIGDDADFETVKTAWREARSPWEQSEGFLYGPVDTEGIDPAIDSWPVDVNAIDALLASSEPITATLLATNDDARGFHTIEYFIWGLDGFKKSGDLTEREVEYLKAATADFQSKTQQLYDGWKASGGNYAANFINAGENGSLYTSQVLALTELVDGMITIADEVGNGKIEDPLNGNGGNAKPEAEESRFSHNSKKDFADNIRSIQNVYLGDYAAVSGKGLTDVVTANNADLNTKIIDQIADAITKIESIPGTFTNAIANNRNEVASAQTAVKTLQTTLESELKPLIQNLK